MSPVTPLHADHATPDELLSRTARGNRYAFAALYDQTAPRALGPIRSVLKGPAQSEEVTQEVDLEIWQNAARFDAKKSSATSVLFTLTRNQREVIELFHDEYLTQTDVAQRLGTPVATVKTRLRDDLTLSDAD